MIESMLSVANTINTGVTVKVAAIVSGPATIYLASKCGVDYTSPHMIGAFITGFLGFVLTSILIHKEVRLLLDKRITIKE